MFSACSVVMHPQFTNVQSILSVNRGETLNQVVDKIGFMPYDVYTHQTTGYKIVTYKYKIIARQLDPKTKDKIGSESNGSKKYLSKLHTALFTFDANDKLISYVTESGRDDAKSLLIDHEMILNYKDYINSSQNNSKSGIQNTSSDSNKKKRSRKANPILP
jgi:hypothetical protein|tara:strand:- start:1208 stop:1690 length:483 start_codon:yes stop_codon:yes gene_type:complete